MKMDKHWELVCDFCGNANHKSNCSKREAIAQFRNSGHIFKGGKSFCDEECAALAKKGMDKEKK